MTFTFARAGLPNGIPILALALVPLVSLVMAGLPEHTDVAWSCNPPVTLLTGIEAAAESTQAIAE